MTLLKRITLFLEVTGIIEKYSLEYSNFTNSTKTLNPFRCGDDICRKMQPIPKQKVRNFNFEPICDFKYKIYKEKTIEVGIYIDRHVYKNMEEVQFC